MRKEPRSLDYWLAGGGTLLALALLTLLLSAATTPTMSLAAPATIRGHNRAAQAEIKAGAMTTGTVYVPLISYQEALMPSLWQGEYYDNAGLTGDPVYTTEETGIDHDWGDDAPAGLPDNYFSIRWTGNWHFEAGQYTFFAYSDDGMRLWLDDELLIDAWSAGMGDHDATVTVGTAGSHQVKVEYFERTGDAAIQVHWRRTDLYPMWHGDYYDEPWVESGKKYARMDSVIQFDWGEGCPEGLTCLQFSVGWEATPVFETGTHRIHFYADEGYQLFVDGNMVMEGGWDDGQDGGGEDDDYDLWVSGTEYHELTFNFHDRGGPAEARLWIENLAYPEWTAEYYDNTNLSGEPVATQQESAVFYDWGQGKPRTSPRFPSADRFSVRWSGPRYFHSGFYRFSLFADDGVRLRIDGDLLVDAWYYGRAQHDSQLTYLDTGYHDVVIEYFENTGEAEVRFWWE